LGRFARSAAATVLFTALVVSSPQFSNVIRNPQILKDKAESALALLERKEQPKKFEVKAEARKKALEKSAQKAQVQAVEKENAQAMKEEQKIVKAGIFSRDSSLLGDIFGIALMLGLAAAGLAIAAAIVVLAALVAWEIIRGIVKLVSFGKIELPDFPGTGSSPPGDYG
jgi:hypothetical protein